MRLGSVSISLLFITFGEVMLWRIAQPLKSLEKKNWQGFGFYFIMALAGLFCLGLSYLQTKRSHKYCNPGNDEDNQLEFDFSGEDKTPGEVDPERWKLLAEQTKPFQFYTYNMTTADSDLNRLTSFKHLTQLGLGNCPNFTGTGLVFFEGAENLKALDISESAVNDNSLQCVALLNNLGELNLSFNEGITDEGLKHLTKLKNLGQLDLESCGEITDEGIRSIATIFTLKYLSLLGNDKITMSGVRELITVSGLETLILNDCAKITKKEIKQFRKEFKKCEIHFD